MLTYEPSINVNPQSIPEIIGQTSNLTQAVDIPKHAQLPISTTRERILHGDSEGMIMNIVNMMTGVILNMRV